MYGAHDATGGMLDPIPQMTGGTIVSMHDACMQAVRIARYEMTAGS